MASSQTSLDLTEPRELGCSAIVRQQADRFIEPDGTGLSTKETKGIIENEEERAEQRQRRLLYEDLDNTDSLHDFDLANIARTALQDMVDKFVKCETPALPRIGIMTKSAKSKAIKVLQDWTQREFRDLEVFINGLETKWKDRHGPVYHAFKKLCHTFEDHKRILSIFPCQFDYISVLCSSLSCIVKAARSHDEIAVMLSKAVADISDKVSTCSNLMIIIKTQRIRKRLADIYAKMFHFFCDAIEWYMDWRLSRVLLSFSDRLERKLRDAVDELDECMRELYNEASIGSAARICTISDQIANIETLVRHPRSNYIHEETVVERRIWERLEAKWEQTLGLPAATTAKGEPRDQEVVGTDQVVQAQTGNRGSALALSLEPFIVGHAGLGLLGRGNLGRVDEELLARLRGWIAEDAVSHTLWVSNPYDKTGTTSARAAALAVVETALQARTPLLSHACERPGSDRVHVGSLEQVGLVGLIYSLIHQLLQLVGEESRRNISERSLEALTGGVDSWEASLDVLRSLLGCAPDLKHCVIDGLNLFELGAGREWCQQLLNLLLARQQQAGAVFHILFTTTGQSMVLASAVKLDDRFMAMKQARRISRVGKRMDLYLAKDGTNKSADSG